MSEGRARLFVALDLPADARQGLVLWRGTTLASVAAMRPVARDALHVTLCFLGSRQLAEIDAIAAACSAGAGSALRGLSLGQAVWLPTRRPRVAAVAVNDAHGELANLQASLSERLSAGGWYEPEARPFFPHVTLARVARGERVRATELPPAPPLSLNGSRVTLYRSRLGGAGVRYEALHTADGSTRRVSR